MADLLGGALASALQGVAGPWPRASLQGCTGSARSNGGGFGPGELTYTTEQLGLLLGAISERLTVAVGGRHLRATDTGCLVEDIRQATEALVWGEKHDDGLFDLFCERQALAGFVTALLAPCVPQPVRVQLWQTLSILVQNARRNTSFYYLLSGGHLNMLLAGDPDLRNEETLAYFVAFMKSLSLRLDGETALLVLDRRPEAAWAGGFPLFAQTVRLATHRDHMICTAARAALLNLLRIDHPEVRSRAAEAACQLLVPSIARALRVSWAAASAALRLQDPETMRVALETEDDLFGFLNDLLLLDVVGVTEALAQGVIVREVLPLLACLAPPLAYPQSCDGDQPEPGALERQQSFVEEYDEARWEEEQQQNQFVGTWFYGNAGSNFRIRKVEGGRLSFEERSPLGRVVSGILHQHGQWREGEISFSEGDNCGRIRLCFVSEQRAILSNFKGVGESRWGPDTFAHQYIGTWFYGKEGNGTCFQISMTDAGQLRYKEHFPSGQRVTGSLCSEDEWLQADLSFLDGKACGTVRLRFNTEQGTMLSNFRGVKERGWGPDTVARKAAQEQPPLGTSFGPAAAEIARTVSSMVLGLEPAQQGLVGAVIDRVLGSSSTGLGEPPAEPLQDAALQSGGTGGSGCTAADVPPEPPAAAVAVHTLATCIRSLASHKGIAVPLAKVLLWPSVPSALAAAVYAPESDAARLAASALGAVASAPASAEGAGSHSSRGPRAQGGGGAAAGAPRRAPPSVLIPNPFRAELLALLGGEKGLGGPTGAVNSGPAPREAPLAAWVLRELQDVLPPYSLEDAGLLPQCAGHGVRSVLAHGGVDGSALVPWLQHWTAPRGSGSCPGMAMAPTPCREEVPEGCLPELLVSALRVQSGLPRLAQRAVAVVLQDVVKAPQAQAARRRAKSAAVSALREAGDALWMAACQDFDGSGGDGGGEALTEMLGGFLEEWDWHRSHDKRVDLLATTSSVQALLQCLHGHCQSPTSPASRTAGTNLGRHATRTFLTLRRLCFDLVALDNRSSTGRDQGDYAKDPCPLGSAIEQDAQGWADRGQGLSSRAATESWPKIHCIGPWGGVYAQGHALVLHPTLAMVVEPSRVEDGGGVHVCVPTWLATADAGRDPRTLVLRVVPPLVANGPVARKGGVEEVELRFADTVARSTALKHLQGSKAREARRLLSQLRAFIDRSVGQAAAEPLTATVSAWAARWM